MSDEQNPVDQTPAAAAVEPAQEQPAAEPEPQAEGSMPERPAPEPQAESTLAESTPAESTPAEPTPAEPTATHEPPAAESVPASAHPTPEPHRVVYVEAPNPPRIRGNRVVGVLLALVGTVVFAALYALVGAVLEYLQSRPLFGDSFTGFVTSAAYWVPILVFALAFILLVVIVNRGGWAAHVFGSLLLAFVVYFASIGLLLLVANVTGSSATFTRIALYPQVIASAVIAREVAVWLGLGIAARGRRVKARNVEARDKYDRDLAEQRAQYERPAERVE